MSESREARKRAIDEYKERKPDRGVFAVRCRASGRTWVGASPNLRAARNGLWFMLRTGSCRDKDLQAEWQARGEAAFEFEILEELEEEAVPLLVQDLLKQRTAAWAAREGAGILLP